MKYSEYDSNQFTGYPVFEELCGMFFELASSDSQKEKLQSVLFEGGYNDYCLSSKICSKDNLLLEMRRRVSMAYLIVQNEDTFDEIVSDNINLFHGTNSLALEGIIKNGLVRTEILEKEGIAVVTGERHFQTEFSRDFDFISLTDIYDVAEDYSDVDSSTAFNVIIGTNLESISNLKKIVVSSDTSEIGIKDKLPLENIKMIGVPSDRVEYVKQLVHNDNIKVLGVDGIEDRFYCLDSLQMDIYYDEYNKVKNSLNYSNDINGMLNELSSRNDISKSNDGIINK